MAEYTHIADLKGEKGDPGESWTKGSIPSGTNLDTFREPGSWNITSTFIDTITGYPEGVTGTRRVGTLTVEGSGSIWVQRFVSWGGSMGVWVRSATSATTWNPWTDLTASEDGGDTWNKGNVPSNTNLDDFNEPGSYQITSSAINTVTGYPAGVTGNRRIGTLTVEGQGQGGSVRTQTFVSWGSNMGAWVRSASSSSTWNAWVQIYPTSGALPQGLIPNNAVLYDLGPGVYTVRSTGIAEGIPDLPEAWPGVLEIMGNHTSTISNLRVWRYYPYNRDYHFEAVSALGSGMMPWKQISHDPAPPTPAPAPTYSDSGLANRVRMDEFTGAMGGKIPTGGIGAVSIRIDHGLANFNSMLRPLFEARNIPYSLVLASRRWDHAENTGVTPAMVNSWVQGGLCEIWNHGASAHDDVEGYDAIYDYWVTGKSELEAQLPAAKIWGAAIPGTSDPERFDGLGNANTPERIYNSMGGQIILGSHAIIGGYMPGTADRVLDGTPRQGQGHWTIDTLTPTTVINRITTAQNAKRGCQIMIHPSRVGLEGYITAAQIEEVLDHIVTERDAGRLAVLSPYQSLLADSTQ